MADDDMNMEEEGGLLERIKESPRTVSALIIILIVAAAIYAFSGDDNANIEDNGEVDAEVSEELAPDSDADSDVAGSAGEQAEEVVEIELPEPSQTDQAYVEVAQPGNGLTHIARSAAARWLAQNNAGYEVTNEHKIYIEDYIKDNMKRMPVALGAEVAVSFDLIADAVGKAGELNEKQLKNLEKYSSKVFI